MLEMRREPISTPFLPKNSDVDFQDSLHIFKLILRYMNDTTLTPGQDALLADYIVQMVTRLNSLQLDQSIRFQGLSQPAQRDEVFVQLCNQTYKNHKEKNAERGWCLMALCASAFAPSDKLFKPLLRYRIRPIVYDCNMKCS
jgi:myosin-15